ncbi:hypothetical protein BGZ72_002195, partial [Mortierella alpina]
MARVTLVRDCPVPCPNQRFIARIDNLGIMLVLKVGKGLRTRQICVVATHICNGEDMGLRRLGQVLSLITAIEIQLMEDPMMPYVLTGDFNTRSSSPLIEFVVRGRATIPQSHSEEVSHAFKAETWDVRELVDPSALATKAKELRALTKALRNDMVDRD